MGGRGADMRPEFSRHVLSPTDPLIHGLHPPTTARSLLLSVPTSTPSYDCCVPSEPSRITRATTGGAPFPLLCSTS